MIALNVALGVLIGVAAIILVVGAAAWFNRRRSEAWQRAALEMGLAFSAEGNDLVARCGRFKLFRLGRDRRATNVLEGEQWGGHAVIADYRYTTGSGKNSHVHTQTVCLLRQPGMVLPPFVLRREGFGDRVAQALFAAADIDFTDDEAFSKQWVLQGDDELPVRDLFSVTLRHAIAQAPALPAYIEAAGDWLLVHEDRRFRPEDARDLVLRAQAVIALLREASGGR